MVVHFAILVTAPLVKTNANQNRVERLNYVLVRLVSTEYRPAVNVQYHWPSQSPVTVT